ncbi:MAG: hypothetical protein JRJ26_20550 [Deltaproteobacteria bacterium]|nr:hypothetical protein [Deltaproteobacteria bacterium]
MVKEQYCRWTLVVPEGSLSDEAVRLSVEDLRQVAADLGLDMGLTIDTEEPPGNAIVLGGCSRNRVTNILAGKGLVRLLTINLKTSNMNPSSSTVFGPVLLRVKYLH